MSMHPSTLFLTCDPDGINGNTNHRSSPPSAQSLIIEQKAKPETGRDLNKIIEQAVQHSSAKIEGVSIQ